MSCTLKCIKLGFFSFKLTVVQVNKFVPPSVHLTYRDHPVHIKQLTVNIHFNFLGWPVSFFFLPRNSDWHICVTLSNTVCVSMLEVFPLTTSILFYCIFFFFFCCCLIVVEKQLRVCVHITFLPESSLSFFQWGTRVCSIRQPPEERLCPVSFSRVLFCHSWPFELKISQLFRKALVMSPSLFFIFSGLGDNIHCISCFRPCVM